MKWQFVVLAVVMIVGGLAGAVYAQGPLPTEVSALDQDLFLEPFASDGERSSTNLKIGGGRFWVAIGIYALERTSVTVKIPYAPEGTYPHQNYWFVDFYQSEGTTGSWAGPQQGYLVFTGEAGPYLDSGEPNIIGVELEAILDSRNAFNILVQANGQEYACDTVYVTIGSPPPIRVFLPLITN